jgi:2-oxoglutarate ferredoxin oxidoreductase subunit alpha
MNAGQMYDDVKLAVEGNAPVEFYGRLGGVVPYPDEILDEIQRLARGPIVDQNGFARQRWLERLALARETE